jgi:hypothetical protein
METIESTGNARGKKKKRTRGEDPPGTLKKEEKSREKPKQESRQSCHSETQVLKG